MRSQGEELHGPPYCDALPDTRYTRTLEKTLGQRRKLTDKTKANLENWKHRVQEETCSGLFKECPDDDDDYHRTWKERLLRGHIPSPCDNEDSLFYFATHGQCKRLLPHIIHLHAPLRRLTLA
jgi:hypothetical protein